MKKHKALETRDVIEVIEVAAPPDRVVALLSGGALTSWRLVAGTVEFRGDIVGDHVVATFHVDAMTPAFIALSCESTSPDLGWAGTRAHVAIAPVAIARTATGSRVAIVHAGVPANGASRELWCGFLAELAAVTRAAAA